MTSSLPAAVRNHLAALRMLLVLTVICGIAYPLAVTGVAQAAFPHQAEGSRVEVGGEVVGSSLIGQSFDLPEKHPGDPDEVARPAPAGSSPARPPGATPRCCPARPTSARTTRA